MHYVLIGLPGERTRLSALRLSEKIAETGRTVETRAVASLQDCARAALEARSDDLINIGHALDRDLVATLVDRADRCFVLRDDARTAFWMLIGTGAEAMTDGFHAIMPAAPGAPVAAFRRVMASLATIATLTDAGVGETTQGALGAERLAERLAAPDDVAPVDAPVDAPDREQGDALAKWTESPAPGPLAPVVVEMIETLRSFEDGRAGVRAPIVLRAPLFIDGDWPHGDLDGPIDVSGRPRVLFFGPYVCLPVGYWECDVYFSLSADAVQGEYVLDAIGHRSGSNMELAVLRFTLSAPGPQMARLTFYNPAADTEVEFRIQSTRPMFDGTLALDRVELLRRRDAAQAVAL